MKLSAEEIFTPGAFPEYTYISRKSEISDLSYEFRLEQAIKVSGFLTSLVGPSKMGKTILCEKVIGFDNIIEISGVDLDSEEDFWKLIAIKAGMSYEGKFSTEKTIDITDDKYKKQQSYVLSKDKIIEYYNKNRKVLVIDDFHYANEGRRMYVAKQLKDAIRRGFRAIVVSLPHRADEAIRQNADLSGRLSLINMESWKVDELKEIALLGFGKLGIQISENIATKIAIESLSSPQLMQYICLNVCMVLDMEKSDNITDEVIEKAYRYTTVNFEYGDVVSFILKGPNTRGRQRNKFLAYDDREYDLYSLLVKSIAENPPVIRLDFEEIKKRINALIRDKQHLPTMQQIKDSLSKVHELISGREDIFHVFDWKDDVLYILDPLFLFYLRWGDLRNVWK